MPLEFILAFASVGDFLHSKYVILTTSDMDKNNTETIPDMTAKNTCSPVQHSKCRKCVWVIRPWLFLEQSNIDTKNPRIGKNMTVTNKLQKNLKT